ncbi:MOSC domain containing protein [Paenibacillus curdlanolyticus YK9]|uniref:MOSC domain containing protein n=1 Tax=Paenibacillus curdlanolyticus YK9 TaxID=717606 RepID=E0I582_9BACL|nr:MOSC domain-containing protein [Paenibacillus curdlanolyticus]EFM12124.1 MOSC domain containing protein [Paenibacillus curdlanolyticus YK9]
MIALKATIAAINVGMPAELAHGGKFVQSGIVKRPVTGAVLATEHGLPGDGQADLVNHGGPDKAVCVYGTDHFPYWEQLLGHSLTYGAFGENISLSGWNESDWCIGDKIRFGGALMQVSQPRQPCFKLAALYDVPELADWVAKTGFTGFYLRVLEAGAFSAGDEAIIVERHSAAITIAEANRVMHIDKSDAAGMRRLLAVAELSDSWQNTLNKRLLKLEGGNETA